MTPDRSGRTRRAPDSIENVDDPRRATLRKAHLQAVERIGDGLSVLLEHHPGHLPRAVAAPLGIVENSNGPPLARPGEHPRRLGRQPGMDRWQDIECLQGEQTEIAACVSRLVEARE